MLKKRKEHAGITLIALIITVIIMLILAGVAINLSIGENGIFEKARTTAEGGDKASVQEEIEFELSSIEMEGYKKNKVLTTQELASKLETRLEGCTIEVFGDVIEGEYKGYLFEVDQDDGLRVGGLATGDKPTGKAEIIEEADNAVTIQVTGNMEQGEIVSIEALNGATKKEDESNTKSSQLFVVDKNGTYQFKIRSNTGKSLRVSCNVYCMAEAKKDIFTALKEVEGSSNVKIDVTGRTSTTTTEETVRYNMNVIVHKGDMVLDGTTNYEGATLADNVYSFGKAEDTGNASAYAQNTVVLKVEGNLTINQDITLTAVRDASYGGPKGMIVYCTGKITNNGTVSMTQRGAKAEGQNVYLFKDKNGEFQFVPGAGANGGTVTTGESGYQVATKMTAYATGRAGSSATVARATGGGGAGRGQATSTGSASVRTCAGGQGTSYSGGAGGGGSSLYKSSTSTAGNPSNTGIAGSGAGGGQGAGNPSNGTGGLLIVYCSQLEGEGAFTAEGSIAPSHWLAGGASGGGSINIFTLEQSTFSRNVFCCRRSNHR